MNGFNANVPPDWQNDSPLCSDIDGDGDDLLLIHHGSENAEIFTENNDPASSSNILRREIFFYSSDEEINEFGDDNGVETCKRSLKRELNRTFDHTPSFSPTLPIKNSKSSPGEIDSKIETSGSSPISLVPSSNNQEDTEVVVLSRTYTINDPSSFQNLVKISDSMTDEGLDDSHQTADAPNGTSTPIDDFAINFDDGEFPLSEADIVGIWDEDEPLFLSKENVGSDEEAEDRKIRQLDSPGKIDQSCGTGYQGTTTDENDVDAREQLTILTTATDYTSTSAIYHHLSLQEENSDSKIGELAKMEKINESAESVEVEEKKNADSATITSETKPKLLNTPSNKHNTNGSNNSVSADNNDPSVDSSSAGRQSIMTPRHPRITVKDRVQAISAAAAAARSRPRSPKPPSKHQLTMQKLKESIEQDKMKPKKEVKSKLMESLKLNTSQATSPHNNSAAGPSIKSPFANRRRLPSPKPPSGIPSLIPTPKSDRRGGQRWTTKPVLLSAAENFRRRSVSVNTDDGSAAAAVRGISKLNKSPLAATNRTRLGSSSGHAAGIHRLMLTELPFENVTMRKKKAPGVSSPAASSSSTRGVHQSTASVSSSASESIASTNKSTAGGPPKEEGIAPSPRMMEFGSRSSSLAGPISSAGLNPNSVASKSKTAGGAGVRIRKHSEEIKVLKAVVIEKQKRLNQTCTAVDAMCVAVQHFTLQAGLLNEALTNKQRTLYKVIQEKTEQSVAQEELVAGHAAEIRLLKEENGKVLNDELNRLILAHEQNVIELNGSHARELTTTQNEQSAELQKEIKRLKTKHELRLQRLVSEYSNKLEEKEQELTAEKRRLDGSKAEHQQLLSKYTEVCSVMRQEADSHLRNVIDDRNSYKEVSELQLNELKQLRQKVAELTAKVSEIPVLQSTLHKLTQEKEDLEVQVQRKRDVERKMTQEIRKLNRSKQEQESVTRSLIMDKEQLQFKLSESMSEDPDGGLAASLLRPHSFTPGSQNNLSSSVYQIGSSFSHSFSNASSDADDPNLLPPAASGQFHHGHEESQHRPVSSSTPLNPNHQAASAAKDGSVKFRVKPSNRLVKKPVAGQHISRESSDRMDVFAVDPCPTRETRLTTGLNSSQTSVNGSNNLYDQTANPSPAACLSTNGLTNGDNNIDNINVTSFAEIHCHQQQPVKQSVDGVSTNLSSSSGPQQQTRPFVLSPVGEVLTPAATVVMDDDVSPATKLSAFPIPCPDSKSGKSSNDDQQQHHRRRSHHVLSCDTGSVSVDVDDVVTGGNHQSKSSYDQHHPHQQQNSSSSSAALTTQQQPAITIIDSGVGSDFG